METIDINKVAGLQALDSEGNVLGVVSMEQLTDMVAGKLATELAAQNTAPAMRTMSLTASPAAASVSATGVDKPERQLLDVSDPQYVRVIGPDGNSGKQGISQFAQVVGGLLCNEVHFTSTIGIVKTKIRVDKDQTQEIDYYRGIAIFFTPINHGIALASLPAKWNSTITVINNATSNAINFNETKNGVAITLDTEKEKMIITNYSQTTDVDIVFISCE